MRHDNQLRYAKSIITEYDGRTPLAAWLKQYFRDNKQMGSRDRKLLSSIVYSYYRLGHNTFSSIDERLHTAITISPELKDFASNFPLVSAGSYTIEKIFPWTDLLSENVDPIAFSNSFLVQPDLFIRIRPGKRQIVLKKLNNAGIVFREVEGECIALHNSTKLDAVLELNSEAVIQDKSSQATGSLFTRAADYLSPGEIKLWDCCAASGGKSIMAYDLLEKVHLTVSDKRETIISNLRQRFVEAGITGYRSFVVDLTEAHLQLPSNTFDLVIADVPCSGSGTWSRTPEQLYFTPINKIDYYSDLQRKIVDAVLPSIAKNGMLVYITCSVFRKENEDIITLLNAKGMTTVTQQIFAGYENRADTLFGALLTNSSA